MQSSSSMRSWSDLDFFKRRFRGLYKGTAGSLGAIQQVLAPLTQALQIKSSPVFVGVRWQI